MFSWHDNATKHFIHLHDVAAGSTPSQVGLGSQFQRSWFLQELLANTSESTLFYNADWQLLGSRRTLAREICRTLDILPKHLNNFRQACVAAKLSWGSRLTAAVAEDKVYAVLKILGVSMELRYGEGEFRAFQRLQEAIVDAHNDESIFAWFGKSDSRDSGADAYLLAPSINCYAGWWCANMQAEAGEGRFRLIRDNRGTARSLIASLPSTETRSAGQQLDVDLRCHASMERGSGYDVGLSLEADGIGTGTWSRTGIYTRTCSTYTVKKSSIFKPTKERKPVTLAFSLNTRDK